MASNLEDTISQSKLAAVLLVFPFFGKVIHYAEFKISFNNKLLYSNKGARSWLLLVPEKATEVVREIFSHTIKRAMSVTHLFPYSDFSIGPVNHTGSGLSLPGVSHCTMWATQELKKTNLLGINIGR